MQSFRNRNGNTLEDPDFKFEWKPFLRQLFVCSGVWTNSFVFGLSIGAPAVLIPQLRQDANSTSVVSKDMESWISSGSHMTSVIWVILLPFLTTVYGRRIAFIILATTTLIGFTVFYCSTTVLQILVGELMIGAALGTISVVSPMVITEYTSPRYRGSFLTMKPASMYWGVWVANAIGTFTHWRNIGILGILCSAFTMTAFFWPESPDWLASKGRFEECTEAHRWLKGTSNRSEDELRSRLITSEEQTLNSASGEVKEQGCIFRKLLITMKDRQFYRPFYLCVVILLLLSFSGKSISSMYSLVMIKKITGSTSAAYSGMLILDGVTVLSIYVGCVLIKFFKRRAFILFVSSISILFMFTVSLQLYLIKLDIISGNNVLSVVLLSGYSMSVTSGPVILSISISELLPLKYKGSMILMVAMIGNLLTAVFLKISLLIFELLGMHGTFMLYGIPSMFFLYLLYKHLPETRDRTLQEIEEFFK